MFDIGGGELLLILVTVLVLFGPKKLPELAQSFGKGMKEFKKAQQHFKDQMDEVMREEPTNIYPDNTPSNHQATILPDEETPEDKSNEG